jgi:UDP-N-acetylmuramate: L-alanyl-gamma-D-glutamyl-meso-diaminopimelate ligase
MKLHFIAIGGSAMHNLAIALVKKGYHITGSDDEIFEPSKSRLKKYGILPDSEGWNPARVNPSVDAVILGMHARTDNPELLKAKELGLKIFSYPEFLYEKSKNKKRVVIGGSHGKTTITSMILHVLNACNFDCDYMVGAQLEGFEVMVKLTESSPIMVLEGDEYLTSPIDRRPKFHLYKPDIALISGIAWDHINVFPTFENYIDQFHQFADLVSTGGTLVYCSDDENVNAIGLSARKDITALPYSTPDHVIENGITKIVYRNKTIPLKVFGEHNLMNLEGARIICNQLGVKDEAFYEAIRSFSGASKRLELVAQNDHCAVFKDFAHSPSKLLATTNAVKKQFPDRKLVACIELHTFSSLSENFLSHYKGCLDDADIAKIFFSPHSLQLKKLPAISKEQVKEAFGNSKAVVYTDSKALLNDLLSIHWKNKNLLMMSSGDFEGLNISHIGDQITR